MRLSTKALSLILLMSTSAYIQANVYAGAALGFSSAASPNLASSTSSNQQYTYAANLGYDYNINQHFAGGIEGNYTNYGKTSYSSASPASSGNFKNSAIQVLITGTYLMDNGVNTFVKAGMVHEQSNLNLATGSTSISNWIPALAGGIGYRVLKNLNLYIQYQHNFGKNWANATASSTPNEPASMDSLTAGFNYLFPM